MYIHIVIHHHDVFTEHHLTHAPEAVHDFVGLHGIGFFDAHKNQIVKHTFSGQGYVHDLREIHLEDGQE